MSNVPDYILKKRKGPDFWVKLVSGVGILSWFFLITVLVIIDKAKPQQETFFERIKHVKVRTYWDSSLMEYAFYLMVFSFFLGVFTLFVNSKRHKRDTDRYNRSVIMMTVLSFIGSIIYLIKF